MSFIVKGLKDLKALAENISEELKSEGFAENQYDMQKVIEEKTSSLAVETKANEVMHTSNTGAGAELVPGAILATDFIDIVPKISPFIGALGGYHGRNMPLIADVAVIGELPFHNLGDQWTGGAGSNYPAQGAGKVPTAKIEIRQKKYEFSVDVSDEEIRFVNVVDILATIQRKIAMSASRTQEALLLNGDTTATATGNINNDDATPAATSYYLGADGLRKAGLANGVDVGTLEFDDFLAVLAKLEDQGANPSEILWLFNHNTYTKALGVTEFKDSSINGRGSTIFSGALTNVLGSDVFVGRDFPKTEADGKVSSVTPANNVKGGFLAAHRNAVQYGYAGEYMMEVSRVPGKGYNVHGHYFMGANTVDNATGATIADLSTMVAAGYNVTV